MDEILAKLSNDPDAIAELTRAELEEAKTALTEAGREQSAIAKDSDQDAEARKAALEAAAEAKERLDAVKERLEVFAEEDAEMESKAAELETAFAEDETEEDETPEVPAAEEEVVEVTDEEIAEVIESETITASKPSIGALAKRTPKPQVESAPALVASSGPNVDGRFRDGFSDPEQLGEAAEKLWRSYGMTSKVDAQALVASFDTGSMHPYEVTGDAAHDGEVIDKLISDIRGKDLKALTAASGICAPAQPVYDFFSISAEDGMIMLPSVNASRGALTYPTSVNYQDIVANSDWSDAVGQVYTDADAIAGTSKNVFAVECPETFTCTVEAYPVILQFGNFTQRFYPEAIAHAVAESARFHSHFVNGNLITDMVTAATASGGGDTGGGGIVNVANLINFEASKYRDQYRMDMDARLELVAPAWVRDALVADFVARNATTDWGNARGRIAELLGALNLNVQWVSDWQSIGDAGDGGWRTAADFLLYAPGSYVRLDGGTLDLGIVRDSTLNATNVFQTFTESFEAVCNIGPAVLIDDVTICPRGSAGLDVALDCNPGFGS